MRTPRKGHSRKPIPLDKDAVIQKLVEGWTIAAICRDSNYANTNSFYRLKKNDPTFAEKVDAIADSPHRQQLAVTAVNHGEGSPLTWQDSYLTDYRQHKNRIRAADAAGKLITEIFQHLDPGHEEYDETFSLSVREEEIRTAVFVEDAVIRKATIEGDYRAQTLILPSMPVVGEKYDKTKKPSAGVQGDVNMFFFADRAALDGTRTKLTEMFNKTTVEAELVPDEIL